MCRQRAFFSERNRSPSPKTKELHPHVGANVLGGARRTFYRHQGRPTRSGTAKLPTSPDFSLQEYLEPLREEYDARHVG